MLPTQHRVFMVGWEYPPHNSGGLGVACEGITKALAGYNTQIYFTLPYPFAGTVDHMQLITCADAWDNENGQSNRPPFAAYAAPRYITQYTEDGEAILLPNGQTLISSEMEHQVEAYTEQVVTYGQQLQNRYDVIHAHDWMSFPAAVELQAATHKPMIAHIHSTEFDRIPGGHGSNYITHTEYTGLQYADKVIAVSHFTKRILIDRYAVDPNKIEVVHNGIAPLHHFNQADFAGDRPMIVFMGRLTAQKGADYFLQLAKNVLKEIPNALFVIAGNGDQYYSLLLHNAEQQLSASVLFTGFLRDKQRDALLSRADAFVMPSLSEPFGLVALEAAQRHTPVIVSHNSGVKEVLPSAIQADFWDLNKMTEAIVKILRDQNYKQQVIAGQMNDLSQTTWENTAQKIINLYADVATQKAVA